MTKTESDIRLLNLVDDSFVILPRANGEDTVFTEVLKNQAKVSDIAKIDEVKMENIRKSTGWTSPALIITLAAVVGLLLAKNIINCIRKLSKK